MATAQGPAGPRRRLGAELRRLRHDIGLQLADVAKELDCSPSKISRLENGKGIPQIVDVDALMVLYGVVEIDRERIAGLVRESRQQGWWERYTEGVQSERLVMAAARYTSLETEAVGVRSFESSWVHGLLQIPDYTRAVLRSLLVTDQTLEEIDRLVELRLKRQEALTEREPPLRLTVVMDESVLCRVVGSAAVMAAQLRSLRQRSELPTITVQVLPFECGLHRAHAGPFQILEFADTAGADIVFIEGPAGDTFNRSDVDLYKDVLVDVAARALDPVASRAMIRRYEAMHAPRGKALP
jgi:transcriptional regulator with XRE-family HTH domain